MLRCETPTQDGNEVQDNRLLGYKIMPKCERPMQDNAEVHDRRLS